MRGGGVCAAVEASDVPYKAAPSSIYGNTRAQDHDTVQAHAYGVAQVNGQVRRGLAIPAQGETGTQWEEEESQL